MDLHRVGVASGCVYGGVGGVFPGWIEAGIGCNGINSCSRKVTFRFKEMQ